jgi:hypothetical protein
MAQDHNLTLRNYYENNVIRLPLERFFKNELEARLQFEACCIAYCCVADSVASAALTQPRPL